MDTSQNDGLCEHQSSLSDALANRAATSGWMLRWGGRRRGSCVAGANPALLSGRALSEWMTAADPAKPDAARARPDVTDSNGSILVVDDNEFDRVLTSRVLGHHGFDVTVAVNGMDAIEIVKKQQFGLIVTDVMMPVMDGITAARHIRGFEKPGDYRVPIIALTSLSLEMDRRRCFDAGMDYCLTKPVPPSELIDTVICFIRRPAETPRV